MGSSAIFGGMIAGFGERMSERNTQLIEQETQRRKDLVALYTMLYNQPNMPPEMRQMFLEFMMEIPQLDPLKKMPKKYTDLGAALERRRELQDPTLPSTAIPDGSPGTEVEPPAPPPDPGALLGAAAPPAAPTPPEVAAVTRPPEAPAPAAPSALAAAAPPVPVPALIEAAQAETAPPAPAPAPVAPAVPPPAPAPTPAPAVPPPAPAPAAPAVPYTPPGDVFAPTTYEQRPAPSLEFTPREQAILDRVASGRATATEINEAQQYMRAKIPPPDITFPRPVPVSAGGAVAHVDPVTGQPTGKLTEGPPALGSVPGVGTLDAYVERAFGIAREQKRMQGLPPTLTLQEQNDIVEQAQEDYPRERQGQWERVFDVETNVEIGAVNYERQAFRPIPLGRAGDYADAASLTNSPLSDTARKDKSALEIMLQDTQRLDVLANMNRDKIGPGWGRYYGQARKFYDIGESANRMFRIAQNLRDLLVRARSGAQINEREMAELEKIMPNPAGTESTFFANLKEFQLESMRHYRKRFRVEYRPLLIQDDGSVWETTDTGRLRQIDQLF